LAEPSDQLRLIHDDRDACGRARHDLLPQQRATQPLDQVQLAIHLVRTIDGEIKRGKVVQITQRYAELACVRFGRFRRGNADDVVQFATTATFEDDVQNVTRGRTRSETEAHPVLDQ